MFTLVGIFILNKPIPLEIAIPLCEAVCRFLLSCGGNYERVTAELQQKLLLCIASRQFIIKIRGDDIKYFCCWFKLDKERAEMVRDRVLPTDVFNGDIVYISEIASTEGMREIVKRLYKLNPEAKEVFWHRPVKGDKVFHFKVRGNGYGR